MSRKKTGMVRVTSRDLGEQYERVQQHPIGGLLLDDLAATSQFGKQTARVGIAADGNPCVIGHDKAAVMAMAASIQNQTVVHTNVVPPIHEMDFHLMLRNAAANLSKQLPPGAQVEELEEEVTEAEDDEPSRSSGSKVGVVIDRPRKRRRAR